AQPEDGPFQLPGRGVGARERKVPRDVVLQDGCAGWRERVLHTGHLHDAFVIPEHRLRLCFQHYNLRFRHTNTSLEYAHVSVTYTIARPRRPRPVENVLPEIPRRLQTSGLGLQAERSTIILPSNLTAQ